MAQQIKVNSSTGNIQIQISRGAIGPSTTANVANTANNLNAASTANVVIGGGVSGYVLSTDGAGTTSWVAQTGGGATNPAGANTQVQFNDQGSFGAESTFTYDKTTDVLSVDHFSGEGGNLSNIQGANVSGEVAFAATANAVALANVAGAGNIASVNLDGNVANVLAGDGTFIAAGGGATVPGGSNTQVQYNDNGSFAGEAGFEYDDVTNTLTVDNISANISGTVTGDVDGALLVDVYNDTGVTLNKGDAVYLVGPSTGDNPHVAPADADDPTKMPALGVIKENIAPTAVGQVVTSGVMNDSSHGYTLGADLYVSTTPGQLTTTIPTGESEGIQKIGKVVNANQIIVQGAFRTNATPNLDEGNIFIGNATNQTTTANLQGEINTHLAAFGSNTITTTGNVETGNLTATTSLFVDGVDGNVLIQPNVAVNGKTYSSVVRGEYDTVASNSTTSQAFVTDNYTTQGVTNIQSFANTAAGALAEGPSITFNNYQAIGNSNTDPIVGGQLTLSANPTGANLANATTATTTSIEMGSPGSDGFLTIVGAGAAPNGYLTGAWKQFQYRDIAMDFVRRNGNGDNRVSSSANDNTTLNFYNTQDRFGGGSTGVTWNYPARFGSKVDPTWVDPQDGSLGIPQGFSFTVVDTAFANLEHRMYANGDTTFNVAGGGTPITLGYNGVITGDGGGLSNIASSNVVGLGNIATINLDGNVSNVLAGDGTFIAAGGGGGIQAQIANGTSNVDIATADGNVDVTVNGNTVMVATDTGTVVQNEPSGNITISPTLSTAYGAGTFVSNQYNPATMGIFRRNGNSTNKTSSVANDETSIDFYNTQDRFGGGQTGVPWNYPARIGSKVDPTWVDPQDTTLGVPQGIFFTAVNDAYANIEHRMYGNGDVEFNASGGTSVTIGNNGVITGDGGGLSNVSLSPAGFADSVQFNDGGTALGGDSVFTYSSSGKQLFLTGAASGTGGIPTFNIDNGGFNVNQEEIGGGAATFAFNNYYAGSLIAPTTYFRAKGTKSSPTAVGSGDQIINEGYYVNSGPTATYVGVGGQSATVQANDGTGNVAVTYSFSTAKPANGPNSLDKIIFDTEFTHVAGNLQMDNTSASFVAGRIRQITDVFANLPASPVTGERAMITDGPAFSFGGVVSAGGGSNVMPVYWDGGNWRQG